jgi:two-component system sensor histidine kinase CreC
MKLGTRILLSNLIVFGTCFYLLIQWVMGDLRVRYMEGVEESLVDQARVLAEYTADQLNTDQFSPQALHRIYQNAYQRRFAAQIYGLLKARVDVRVIITDAAGVVRFSSLAPAEEGGDFSQWRDVALTLQGRYGARATRDDPDDPLSTVLYVSAPIKAGGRLLGVLTVGKPTAAIDRFVQFAKVEVAKVGGLAAAAVLLASFVTTFWLTRPIRRLTLYAQAIRNGGRPAPPRLDRSEIGTMGKALESMREALEGKKYAEQYVQSFTHEIKSPLSAIQGAAELLEEEMPPDQRRRFIANIQTETRRIRTIVERLLRLSALETRKVLPRATRVRLKDLLTSITESLGPLLAKKRLALVDRIEPDRQVTGDAFLLRQALSNLIINAVDFSPAGGEIVVTSTRSDDVVRIVVEDSGTGIPAFAQEKIFEKFFSLKRPDSGRKSTGLGLNFVREVAQLHGGEIRLANRPQGGVRARLTLRENKKEVQRARRIE